MADTTATTDLQAEYDTLRRRERELLVEIEIAQQVAAVHAATSPPARAANPEPAR